MSVNTYVKMDWCRGTNPKTGDRIFVGLSGKREAFYQLNDGPALPIPERLKEYSFAWVARTLLLEHESACGGCDAEELTLP